MSSSVMPVSRSVVLNMLLMGMPRLSHQVIRCQGRSVGFLYGDGAEPVLSGAEGPRPKRGGTSLPHDLSLSLPLQRPLQRLVEGGSGLFVIRGRDLALFPFYFQLKHFFF